MAETIVLTKIKIGRRYRKDIGDITPLANSIKEIGLLHPIVIDEKARLIAGQRRIKALEKLGKKRVPVHIVNLSDLARGELDENFMRKDFLPSERVAIARVMEPKLRKQAEQRRKEHGGTAPGRRKNTSGDSPEVFDRTNRETRTLVAKRVGWAHEAYTRACAIFDAAKENPQEYGELLKELDRTRHVNGVFRKLKVKKDTKKISQEPVFPKGPFRVIVADPPWPYPRQDDPTHFGNLPYASMAYEDILAYSEKWPEHFIHENAILWLWTTNAFMKRAYEVLAAWKFEQKTILTWVKDRTGVGNWLLGQTEHCLMAARGKPTLTLNNQSTVLHAPRGKHSEKPDSFYKFVESLCPGAKVELFARKKREHWIVHGIDL